MNLKLILFSPTGGTRRVGEALADAFRTESDNCETFELCVSAEAVRLPTLTADDMAIIAMPVFAGRVPSLAIERLRQTEGNNARCAVVAAYGNRAYDDALIEMHDVAASLGFRVIAAIGAVAEHSIVRDYGHGRPDADDIRELQSFGRQIAQKLANGDDTPPSTPGNRPYRKPVYGPYPKVNRRCDACGACAKGCPAGAIDKDNVKTTDKQKCISCMKCVAACPKGARGVGSLLRFIIARKIKKGCATRKPNELFA